MKAIEDMDNIERRKAYKKLWYRKSQAKKHRNLADFQYYERQMEIFRIYKKHSKKYNQQRDARIRHSRHHCSRRYYRQHPDKVKKAIKHSKSLKPQLYRRLDRASYYRHRKSRIRYSQQYYIKHLAYRRKYSRIYSRKYYRLHKEIKK